MELGRISRRGFTKATAAAALTLTAAQSRQVLGANDRVRLGFIGVANRGSQLIDAFLENPDAEVAALCDICQPTLEKANQRVGGKAVLLRDFRKLLDRSDIDAVVIATPDHWHAIQTIVSTFVTSKSPTETPSRMDDRRTTPAMLKAISMRMKHSSIPPILE